MIRRAAIALALLGSLAALVPANAAAAPEAPAWTLAMTPMPANFAHGAKTEYLLAATNVGAAPSSGQVTLEVTLPGGLRPILGSGVSSDRRFASPPTCAAPVGQSISCETGEALHPGHKLFFAIEVEVLATEGELVANANLQEGGSAVASAQASTPITSEPLPFDFLEGLAAPATNGDGSPAVLAGSHPDQITVSLGFPTERLGDELVGTGHPRDVRVDLPRGLVGSPAATPQLCTEAELTSEGALPCPTGSQIGIVSVTTLLAGVGTTGLSTDPLYSMVPPPGAVAAFGFDAANVGVFIHLVAGVRSGEDYGVYSASHDLLALGSHPIFNIQAQIWGDPSAESHKWIRGECGLFSTGTCPTTQQKIPFLTMPGDCSGEPLPYKALADSWEKPFPEFKEREAFYESADLQGTPAPIEDCGALEYEPTIRAQPSTNLTDSPSGLDFDLHQPQQEPEAEPLGGRATAAAKDVTVSLPAGMTVNPSQASGLGACSEGQIGFEEEEEGGSLRFTENAQSCPDAAKIGTLEATSPALAEYNAEHEVEHDPETGAPLPRPLGGSLYLAQPFANPFGSLVALYLVIEDPKSGIVAKLAGEGQLDPNTGQITMRVKESPELPIEDVRVHAFGGPRGALISPPTCTPQATGAEITPWSAPEAPDVQTSDSFTPAVTPAGGPCPTTGAQMPNAPVLEAGTAEPRAARHSPMVFRVRREDGSQRLSRVEATLPPGLTATLAGVSQCSDADIARAIAREHPNLGATELSDPSCPASSQVGTVSAAVGAGPTPYYANGRAYLAGPYKGAPLSFVIIAPAVAGPFDLGTVVNRVAVYLDPESARPRAVSDPVPQLIDGVPLDLRKITLNVDRPNFILNPTSCDVESFTGAATSALDQVAPLSERFQVGGCKSLPYRPKLHARLFGPIHRGGNPSLRTVVTAKPGEANTARISLAFPRTEFIDQAHFRTICTRVQFAAGACPQGSIYGHARVITPLVNYPLEGPIYLRSSTHELPDIVFALKGPPSQPIEVDLDGRVDSVNGGVRVTFASVPDAPLTKAIVTMQGAQKGLFQNSTNICTNPEPATLKLDAQSGKVYDTQPKLRASCPKKGRHQEHRHAHRR